MSDSDAQRLYSNHPSWEWNRPVSTRRLTTRSWSVTSTSVRICTPTLSSRAVPPCTPASPTACKRRSPPSPHPPWRSRSSPHQSESTLSGSVAPFLPPSPPSNRCGSQSKSTTSRAHPLSTENASRSHSLSQFSVSVMTSHWAAQNAVWLINYQLLFFSYLLYIQTQNFTQKKFKNSFWINLNACEGVVMSGLLSSHLYCRCYSHWYRRLALTSPYQHAN